MLTVENLAKEFDGLTAVNDLNFTVEPNTISGLIGPNGAGKTTTFNMIAGHLKPSSGKIYFDGKEITNLRPHQTFQLGIVRTFQIPRPFSGMTVLENLTMVPRNQIGEKIWNNWLRNNAVAREEQQIREKANGLLEFLNLSDLQNEYSGNLSGGQLKLLELGRALMSDPKVILLDEPAAGVNPTLLEEIIDRIRDIHSQGVTFLIIEHNMELVMRLCSSILVMAEGDILMRGAPEEIRSDPRLIDAFLGGGTSLKND
ncbi:MAG: ABC transporter ATP-binding protein [Gammaproteobacteria bacterium]|jgi:branched-chain amino acid transport system ATP-binding protein|nr:ABC transporter ATP-binding protein [Gammaproteobacteria bacterium]MDE0970929.1 ABC transporter ATP-binding protein [Arenicellales bacterium]|tara:strand:- start:10321 stop:11091 length:771 start_codon:yes stop_codon:yes gene_type:complete